MAESQWIRLARGAIARSVAGAVASARSLRRGSAQSMSIFLRDVGQGLLEVSHNTLALLGFVITAVLLFAASRADLRHEAETWTLSWLQARLVARTEPALATASLPDPLVAELSEPDAIARATAANPSELSRQQAAVANWLAGRYHVAPEPVSRLVQEAWSVGQKAGLDPTLILAIMAVESSFNPFAQSAVGAQGLMQVMTKVHNDKYEAFGGNHAAFDPVTNLRVGVQVLKECISRAGGLEAGLRFYVGAANQVEDGGYASKVLSEQSMLRQVASGKKVSQRMVFAGAPAQAAPAAPKSDARADNPADTASAPEAPRSPEQIAMLR